MSNRLFKIIWILIVASERKPKNNIIKILDVAFEVSYFLHSNSIMTLAIVVCIKYWKPISRKVVALMSNFSGNGKRKFLQMTLYMNFMSKRFYETFSFGVVFAIRPISDRKWMQYKYLMCLVYKIRYLSEIDL